MRNPSKAIEQAASSWGISLRGGSRQRGSIRPNTAIPQPPSRRILAHHGVQLSHQTCHRGRRSLTAPAYPHEPALEQPFGDVVSRSESRPTHRQVDTCTQCQPAPVAAGSTSPHSRSRPRLRGWVPPRAAAQAQPARRTRASASPWRLLLRPHRHRRAGALPRARSTPSSSTLDATVASTRGQSPPAFQCLLRPSAQPLCGPAARHRRAATHAAGGPS
jgi:hypothetical protein